MSDYLTAIYDRNRRMEWLEEQLRKPPGYLGRVRELNELATLTMWKGLDNAAQLADQSGRTWHILERPDKSIVVYYTRQDDPAHYVVFDTLDSAETKGQ